MTKEEIAKLREEFKEQQLQANGGLLKAKKKYQFGKKLGAPTTYKEEFCKLLIDHMSEGMSFETFAAIIGTHRSTLYDWEKRHKTFADAHRRGNELAQEFFEKLGLGIATGHTKGNVAAWSFLCKNRIGWSDSVVVQGAEDDYDYNIPDYLKKINETK